MVELTKKAYNKIFRYAKKMGDDEIGGLLLGEITDGGQVEIDDAIILKQKKSIATFEIDDDDMMEFTKNANNETLKSIIGWWHSHGTGKTFWSGTDSETFKRLCSFFSGFCIGIVVSVPGKEKNMKCRIDMANKNGQIIEIDDIIPELVGGFFGWGEGDDTNLTKSEEIEIEEKVTDDDIMIKSDFDNTSLCPVCNGCGIVGNDKLEYIECKKCGGEGFILLTGLKKVISKLKEKHIYDDY